VFQLGIDIYYIFILVKKKNKIIMKYNYNFNKINLFFYSLFTNLIDTTVQFWTDLILNNSITIFFNYIMKKLRGDLHGY